MSTPESENSQPNDVVAELETTLALWKLRYVQARLELMAERERAERAAPTIVVVPRRRWGVYQHSFGRR